LGKVVITGDGECNTAAAGLGGALAQADRFGPKVSDHPVLCCFHQINRVNSCNVTATMTPS